MGKSLGWVAVLGGFILACPAAAKAESAVAAPTCGARVAPSDDAVPANAPAIVVYPSSGTPAVSVTYLGTRVDPAWPGSFTAAPDPRLPGATLFLPTQSLPAGTKDMLVDFSLDCASIGKTGAEYTRLDVAEPAPLPTTIGTATEDNRTIEVVPSDELRPYRAVTMFEIVIRGEVHVLGEYGVPPDAAGRLRLHLSALNWQVDWCGSSLESDKIEKVELRAHVAGAADDLLPISVDIHTDCSRSASGSSGGPGGSIGSQDAGPDTETSVRDDAGGCTIAANAPAPVWTSFAIGALLVVASRRKRRG